MRADGSLFTTRSGDWTWHFVDEGVWSELAPSPEHPSPDSSIVKANPIRTVFRRGSYFIKVERPESKFGLSFLKALFAPKAKSEFESAQALAAAGIPVVEPLGYGSAGNAQALVTRGVFGAVPVSEYYNAHFAEGEADPENFLRCWSHFVRLVIDSGFQHPDFHNGNILFQPETGEFLLVDVFGVKGLCKVTEEIRDGMRHIIFEMRRGLSPERLISLARECGIRGNHREFVENGLAKEAARLRGEWPKRKRQLLQGYHKFVEKTALADGRELWILLDKGRRPLCSAEDVDNDKFDIVKGQDALLDSFYQALAGIPHRKAVAWEPDSQKLHLESIALAGETTEDELASLDFFAKPFGIDPKISHLGRNSKGRLIVTLPNLKLP